MYIQKQRNVVTTTYNFEDRWTQLNKKACELATAVMMRRQQVHKNHTHIYISLILKVIRLSSKDAELHRRQITWRLRQRAASNAPVVCEINETLRKRTSGEK